jgi:hypothetical protein
MEGNVRLVLTVSVAHGDLDRALVNGAFLVQNVATYPNVRAIRKPGVLKKDQFDTYSQVLRWLGHTA